MTPDVQLLTQSHCPQTWAAAATVTPITLKTTLLLVEILSQNVAFIHSGAKTVQT